MHEENFLSKWLREDGKERERERELRKKNGNRQGDQRRKG